MKNTFLTILLSITLFIQLNSQTIDGIVKDENNKPIAFANVVAIDKYHPEVLLGGITNFDGKFAIENCTFNQFILKVSVIGHQTYIDSSLIAQKIHDPLRIILQPSVEELDEVKIKGSFPTEKLENGNMITRINSTPLAKSLDTEDLLSRIPGVILDEDEFEVLGAGTPVIYINNREVKDNKELSQLLPKDILSVEVITNPGVEYSAGTKAVIKIKTSKKHESIALNAASELRQGRKTSDENQFQLSVNKEKFNFYVNGSLANQRKSSIQDIDSKLYLDPLQSQICNMKTDIDIPVYYLNASFSYTPYKNAEFGISYNNQTYDADIAINSDNWVYLDDTLYYQLYSLNQTKENLAKQHFDFFFTSAITSKLDYSLFVDHIISDKDKTQGVSEVYTDSTSSYNYLINNDISLTGVRSLFNLKTGKGAIKMGGDFSKVESDGLTLLDAEDDDHYNSEETKYGIFTEMSSKIGEGINWQIGIRYENFTYSYSDFLDASNDIDLSSHNFYPHFNISHHKGKFSSSLSYSKRVTRPQLYQLSNTYYLTHFLYQVGNPQLQEQTNHKLEYKLLVKPFTFAATYNYNKNYIGSSYEYEELENEDDLNAMILTYKNYDKYENISITLGINKKWSRLQSILSLYYTKPFFKAEVMGEMVSYNNNRLNLSLSNNFTINDDILLAVYYSADTGGNSSFSDREPHHYLNANVNVSLFNKKMDINLFCNDIFKTRIWEYSSTISDAYLHQVEDQDKHQVGIKLSYNFNKINKRSNKAGALEEESKRL
jgi:hypothetical protein